MEGEQKAGFEKCSSDTWLPAPGLVAPERTRPRLSEKYIRRICRPKGACGHQPENVWMVTTDGESPPASRRLLRLNERNATFTSTRFHAPR